MRPFCQLFRVILFVSLLSATSGLFTALSAKAGVWGKLYIETDPPQAHVRFLGIKYEYLPGIILRDGTYSIEVSCPGYQSVTQKVRLVGGESTTVRVALPPEQGPQATPQSAAGQAGALQIPTTGFTDEPGRLIVITDPPGVPVRFVNSGLRYTPGMPLQPGHYVLEVSDTAGRRVVKEVDITSGRETRILASLPTRGSSGSASKNLPQPLQKFAIPSSRNQADNDPRAAAPQPAPEPLDGQLVVYTEPADAAIRLLDSDRQYQPGMLLPAGTYTLEVSKNGYDKVRQDVDVAGGKIQQLHVRLQEQNKASSLPPSLKKYAIRAPRKAKSRSEGASAQKAPEGGLLLHVDPPDSTIFFLNTNVRYTPGVHLPAGSYQVKIDKPGYESVTIQVEIKAGKELEAQLRLRPKPGAAGTPPSVPASKTSPPQATANLAAPANPDGTLSQEQQLVLEANGLLNTGNYQEAFQRFSQALKIDPEMADAFKGRGFVYYQLGKYKHAIKEYEKCLSYAPDDAEAYYERGNAYLAAGSKKRALRDYNKAITLNPSFPDAYNARGTVHFASKQYLNALEDYTRALNIDGSYADAYFNRATTHMKLGMYELAAKDYDALLRLDPSDQTALKKRQEAYKKLGK